MSKLSPVFEIPNSEVFSDPECIFPKYTTSIINLASNTAQATRPKQVGKVTDLMKDFLADYDGSKDGVTCWKEWYLEHYPDRIDVAVNRIMPMINNMKEAIQLIDEEMVRAWVEDLVFKKTYEGLNIQSTILKKIAEMKHTTYRISRFDEESKGIDGYIGDTAVSVKPMSYKTKGMLKEQIDAKMIFYDKKKNYIEVQIDEPF